jgi:hypothetical protein
VKTLDFFGIASGSGEEHDGCAKVPPTHELDVLLDMR